MNEELLRKIGLTSSEAKVYLALLKIGDFASKGKIIEEARIASSKIYEVLNKLISKGLASSIIKNNVTYFAAANPSRIKDFLEEKKKQISEQEKLAEEIMPKLQESYKNLRDKTTAELFLGWKGMETVYSTILSQAKKGQEVNILGASQGLDKEKTKRFFSIYSSKARLKGVNVRAIFNEGSRDYVKELEKELKIRFNKKFLFKTTPVEIAFTSNVTAIVILKEEPIVILVYDKETAESFSTYFEELWKIAKI